MSREARPGGQRQFGQGAAERPVALSFSHLIANVKADVHKKPIRKEPVSYPTVAEVRRNVSLAPLLALVEHHGETPADDMLQRLQFATGYEAGTPQAKEAMERVRVAYLTHAYSELSPQKRDEVREAAFTQIGKKHYNPRMKHSPYIIMEAPKIPLKPQETNFVIWALNEAGVAHNLQPGAASIDVQPLREKLLKSDPERDIEGQEKSAGSIHVQEGYFLPQSNAVAIPQDTTTVDFINGELVERPSKYLLVEHPGEVQELENVEPLLELPQFPLRRNRKVRPSKWERDLMELEKAA